MARNEIYTVRKLADQGAIQHWQVLKCDTDFNETGSYNISKVGTQYNCTCFASNREICRHRTMLLEFEVEGRIDSHWWYKFDVRKKESHWIEGPKHDNR